MTLRFVSNPADTPVAIDTDGRQLGGKDWGTVESTDNVASAALHAETLLPAPVNNDTPDHELNPRYITARDAHLELVTRADKARQLDKTRLAELAPDAAPGDSKTELVNDIAASDVEIPSSSGRSRSTRKEH